MAVWDGQTDRVMRTPCNMLGHIDDIGHKWDFHGNSLPQSKQRFQKCKIYFCIEKQKGFLKLSWGRPSFVILWLCYDGGRSSL